MMLVRCTSCASKIQVNYPLNELAVVGLVWSYVGPMFSRIVGKRLSFKGRKFPPETSE